MNNNQYRKGIILAGGIGTRLSPITLGISKQLLPIYDKPMIYYPISTLMLAGVREILLITSQRDKKCFEDLLGNGQRWGIQIEYLIQKEPNGLAEAYIIGEKFLQNNSSILILGDNLFYGANFVSTLKIANQSSTGATVFAYRVNDPSRYGVVKFNSAGMVENIEEKPQKPKSNFALTGLYYFDNKAPEMAKEISLSKRGEYEIISLINMYLETKNLNVEIMGRGTAWFDTGTFDSLHEASSFIKTIENRQGLKIGCPEEIAWRNKWISDKQLFDLSSKIYKSGYGQYLSNLIEDI